MKILLIRFSSIGDIVLTSPVIRAVKKQIPNAELHFLCKPAFKEVLEASPYIDKLYVWDIPRETILAELKSENYDIILDLQKNLRSHRIRRALGAKSFAFHKLNLLKWLTVNFKFHKLPDKHLVDRYFEGLEDLGVINDGLGLDFFVSEKNEVKVESISPILNKEYTAIALGAQHKTKVPPESKWIELIRNLKGPIVLLGGNGDKKLAERLTSLDPERVFNTCGNFNIQQSADIIRQCKVMISPDTGLMHIAAAFKKPLISIWGNTIPEFGMYPYMPSNDIPVFRFEVEDLSCRPCSKLGYAECPKGHFKCMMDQDMVKIAETADKISA